ncbi:hypothetical protein J7U46_20940 [Pelomonas sp. V22]|uniref:hypothetical protein n=1 Tax=Pelomonas sp. V22 TaxID=2822139 RepID=UPI0024A9FB2C|nr:hypothetical protein [Pelomonas sp. V22]MDI4635543.1 hypothetical protein [Pelomonas sp. V22]
MLVKNVGLIGLLVLLVQPQCSDAQRLKYNSPAELAGAAAVSPEAGRQILKGLFSKCAVYGEAARRAGEAALAGWEARHDGFLEENKRLKSELLRMASSPTATASQRSGIKNLFEVVVPQTVDAQLTALLTPIKLIEPAEAKASLCIDYAKSVQDGNWELEKNDPAVADFLKQSMRSRTK